MKQRVVSAIVMMLVFIPLLIIGKIPFCVMVVLLGLCGLKELLDLEKEIPQCFKIVAYFITTFLLIYNYSDTTAIYLLDYRFLAIIFLLMAILLVIVGNPQKYNYKDMIYLIYTSFSIGILFSNFIHIRNISLYVLAYLILISTITDVFAYLIGKKFGRHKLAPKTSPCKTIEGSIGGSLFGTLIAVLFYINFVNIDINLWPLIVVTLLLSILGQFGDLFFSSIKRHYGKKDFSNMIPGHGGILDRFDSLLFVLLGYMLFILI